MLALFFDRNRNKRAFFSLLIYAILLTAAMKLAWEIRFDFEVPENFRDDQWRTMIPMVLAKLAFLVMLRQFGSVLAYFSMPDLVRVGWAMFFASLGAFGWWLYASPHNPVGGLPRGVILADLVLSVGFVCGFRLMLRLYRERWSGARMAEGKRDTRRIAIVGAGDVGANLAKEFIGHPARGFRPVVFFDDDLKKRNGLVHGIPVFGAPEEVRRAREKFRFDSVVVAMPSAPERRIKDVIAMMTAEGVAVQIVPSLDDLTSGKVKVSRIRPVEVTDLLGREQVTLDVAGIQKMIENKVVVVTGAGGSIGGELCRQIAARNPRRLILMEQSEAALFVIEQELIGMGLGAIIQPVVADILDRPRLKQVFSNYRPAIVFHAAAHKHVYLMERQPAEAVKNNSYGTLVLAEEAAAHGVDRFVFISTDKAINPTNVMGASKRLAELLLQETQKQVKGGTRFMAVRFGNVLGSSGSVVPIFKRQIAEGGPVTVTHPDVTRYFMTIPEAVGLVLQASILGSGGEIFVLDMGKPVKIADLARQMIQLSGFLPGEDIEIKFTGLKPGEKLYEELQHETEQHGQTAHPRIQRLVCGVETEAEVGSVKAKVEGALAGLHDLEAKKVKLWLKEFLPEYTPYLD